MWYIKYFCVKLNIFILTPLVWIQKKYEAYQKYKLEMYVKAMCMTNN